MRYSGILFLVLAALSVAVLQPERITVVGGLGEAPLLALSSAGIAYEEGEGTVTLEVWDWQRERAVQALARSYRALEMAKSVVDENVANRATTKTADGTPYLRQYLAYSADGGVGEVAPDGGDYNWIYDPQHPDAMREGPHSGYVAKPNINLIQEQTSWRSLDNTQKAVRELVLRLDPTVIFSSAPAFPQGARKPEPSPSRAMDFLNMRVAQDAIVPEDVLATLRPLEFESAWQAKQEAHVAFGQPNVQSGQASVASALNWLYQEPRFQVNDIDQGYGFGLLNALKSESQALGLDWRDAGNISQENWPEIEATLARNLPVLVAYRAPTLPGPDRIVMLVGLQQDQVVYADSSTGKLARIARATLLGAPPHADGNFVFLPTALRENS